MRYKSDVYADLKEEIQDLVRYGLDKEHSSKLKIKKLIRLIHKFISDLIDEDDAV